MSDSNTDTSNEIDVGTTENVHQDDADELSEELGVNIQLIDEGAEHEDHADALRKLRDEIDPENPPKSIHMTIREDGVNEYMWLNDVENGPKTEVLAHLANHLHGVANFLEVSPRATASVAADFVDSWDELDGES